MSYSRHRRSPLKQNYIMIYDKILTEALIDCFEKVPLTVHLIYKQNIHVCKIIGKPENIKKTFLGGGGKWYRIYTEQYAKIDK